MEPLPLEGGEVNITVTINRVVLKVLKVVQLKMLSQNKYQPQVKKVLKNSLEVD